MSTLCEWLNKAVTSVRSLQDVSCVLTCLMMEISQQTSLHDVLGSRGFPCVLLWSRLILYVFLVRRPLPVSLFALCLRLVAYPSGLLRPVSLVSWPNLISVFLLGLSIVTGFRLCWASLCLLHVARSICGLSCGPLAPTVRVFLSLFSLI